MSGASSAEIFNALSEVGKEVLTCYTNFENVCC